MKRMGILIALVISLSLMASTAYAIELYQPQSYYMSAESDGLISLHYTYTDDIHADLSFSGNKATCSGYVAPYKNYSASVTVTLYKKKGSSWSYVDSWSGKATGGSTASASGSATVGSGTYKVTVSGNVAEKEFPTKSITKIK